MFVNNWSTFHDEIFKQEDIFHTNGYPKQIFYNHVKKFLSEKLMTTNSCQNVNKEKKYTVIILFISYQSMIFKKSLTNILKSINEKCCTILKTFKVQNFISQKDKTPLALQANVIHLFEGSCGKNQTYINNTKRHLATRVRQHLSGN